MIPAIVGRVPSPQVDATRAPVKWIHYLLYLKDICSCNKFFNITNCVLILVNCGGVCSKIYVTVNSTATPVHHPGSGSEPNIMSL